MDLLRLAARIAHPPEAPASAPFGEYAWGPRREGVPDEPDNELEQYVFDALKAHFATKHVGLPGQVSELLSSILATGWYQPVLHPPPRDVLYRGIKVRGRDALSAILEMEIEEDSGRVDFDGGRTFPVINGTSTSWSAKKGITRDFSERGERGWGLTLVAEVGANPFRFLAGPGGLYDVEGMSSYHLEKETVGLEPIIVSRVEWSRL